MRDIKVLVSDLYGVNVHRNDEQMYADFAAASGRPLDLVVKAVSEAGRDDIKLGKVSIAQYVKNLNGLLETSFSEEQVEEIWNRTLRVDSAMLRLLEQQQRAGRRVVLLTNLNAFDWAGASRLGFAKFEAVLSFQVGLKKPDPAIFKKVMELTGLPVEQHFFTDDQLHNVEAARRIGMAVLLFKNAKGVQDNLDFHDDRDLF